MATVTNRARGMRMLALADGRHATLAPGQTADLDLAQHPVHDAWVAAGHITVVHDEAPASEPVSSDNTEDKPHERKRRTTGNGSAHIG